jgi:hypothetical protein
MSPLRGPFGVRWASGGGEPPAGDPPSAPVTTAATGLGRNSFTANWSAAAGATWYRIDVSESIDFTTYVTGYQSKLLGNVTNLSLSGLNAATTYYYRVRAHNADGASANSNTTSGTTLADGEVPTGHFVSTTGLATWSAAIDVATPCSPTTAMANAVAGDTVYFRGGQYEVTQDDGQWPPHFALNPANSGTVGYPITFIAYPGETPVVNGTVSGTNAGTWSGNNESIVVLGAISRNYVTWDGFTVQADNGGKLPVVMLKSETGNNIGNTIRNFTCNGGTQQLQDGNNWSVIRVEGAVNFTLSNSRLYSVVSSYGAHNTCGYLGYHNSGTIIENCQVDTCTVGIFVKSDEDDITIRNNFIYGCDQGILVTPDLTQMESDRGTVTNNLVINCSVAGFTDEDTAGQGSDDWVLSNNTFYHCGSGSTTLLGLGETESGHGWTLYNNICIPTGARVFWTTKAYAYLVAVDHNQWGTTEGTYLFRMSNDSGNRNYYSVAEWNASTELVGAAHPADLAAADPLFVNGSGNLNTIADFALQSGSPCKGTGRSGADVGCNVTTVGVL